MSRLFLPRVSLVACCSTIVSSATDAQFVESELTLEVPVESQLSLPSFGERGGAILLTGRSEDRSKVISVYRIADSGSVSPVPSIRLEAMQDVLFFDTATIGGRPTLVFLTPLGIRTLDPVSGILEPALTTQSVYRNGSTAPLTHLDFMMDVNGDGREDVVLQDFDGLRILLQNDRGFGGAILLDAPPMLIAQSNESRYRTDQIYLYDFNLDAKPDIAVVRNNEFLVFESSELGGFASEATHVPIDVNLSSEEDIARFEQNLIEIDQSDFRLTRISQIADLNDDGLPDIVTFTAISAGVFEKRSEYHVYLASRDSSGVRYRAEPDAEILSDGFQINLSIVDADNDSYQDIVSASVEFGLRELISALVTRSVGLDVALHRFRQGSVYDFEPDFQTRIRLRFNIANGFITNPAVRFADFNADGHADLLLQRDRDSLEITPGTSNGSRFDGEPWSWTTSLPLDGTLIEVVDADGDDRQDLLIGYGPGDGDEMRSKFRVLISRL